jgi:hypothetical protein
MFWNLWRNLGTWTLDSDPNYVQKTWKSVLRQSEVPKRKSLGVAVHRGSEVLSDLETRTSHFTTDSHSVLVSSPIWGSLPDFGLSLDSYCFIFVGRRARPLSNVMSVMYEYKGRRIVFSIQPASTALPSPSSSRITETRQGNTAAMLPGNDGP